EVWAFGDRVAHEVCVYPDEQVAYVEALGGDVPLGDVEAWATLAGRGHGIEPAPPDEAEGWTLRPRRPEGPPCGVGRTRGSRGGAGASGLTSGGRASAARSSGASSRIGSPPRGRARLAPGRSLRAATRHVNRARRRTFLLCRAHP